MFLLYEAFRDQREQTLPEDVRTMQVFSQIE